MAKKGFTLIELLVVVAIVGILAAIAIPNLLVAVQRSKQRRTMVDMRNIATAWEARNSEVSRYNAAGGAIYEECGEKTEISTLVSAVAPTYIRKMPTMDAWGTPFSIYIDVPWTDTKPAQKYVIVSGGQDGKIDTEALEGPITNFDCDIIFSSGRFLSYPEGAAIK
jgi:type IV pilus assembly protein PilA